MRVSRVGVRRELGYGYILEMKAKASHDELKQGVIEMEEQR